MPRHSHILVNKQEKKKFLQKCLNHISDLLNKHELKYFKKGMKITGEMPENYIFPVYENDNVLPSNIWTNKRVSDDLRDTKLCILIYFYNYVAESLENDNSVNLQSVWQGVDALCTSLNGLGIRKVLEIHRNLPGKVGEFFGKHPDSINFLDNYGADPEKNCLPSRNSSPHIITHKF